MKRILVIDDDTSQREVFRESLEKAGYEVLEAPDGQTGLQVFRQQPCHLVITDIFMPEKEGLETILELKREFLYVRIIAVSGGMTWPQDDGNLMTETVLEAAERLGADRTLHKPVTIQRLLNTVDEVLRTL
jgi:CheY-like chemotaxis protein